MALNRPQDPLVPGSDKQHLGRSLLLLPPRASSFLVRLSLPGPSHSYLRYPFTPFPSSIATILPPPFFILNGPLVELDIPFVKPSKDNRFLGPIATFKPCLALPRWHY